MSVSETAAPKLLIQLADNCVFKVFEDTWNGTRTGRLVWERSGEVEIDFTVVESKTLLQAIRDEFCSKLYCSLPLQGKLTDEPELRMIDDTYYRLCQRSLFADAAADNYRHREDNHYGIFPANEEYMYYPETQTVKAVFTFEHHPSAFLEVPVALTRTDTKQSGRIQFVSPATLQIVKLSDPEYPMCPTRSSFTTAEKAMVDLFYQEAKRPDPTPTTRATAIPPYLLSAIHGKLPGMGKK